MYSVPGNALAILNDGTFRLLAATETTGPWIWQRLNLQLGDETNWLAVAESHRQTADSRNHPKFCLSSPWRTMEPYGLADSFPFPV